MYLSRWSTKKKGKYDFRFRIYHTSTYVENRKTYDGWMLDDYMVHDQLMLSRTNVLCELTKHCQFYAAMLQTYSSIFFNACC